MPFDMWKAAWWTEQPLSTGKATYDPLDWVLTNDQTQAVPRKILFEGGCDNGALPWLKLGIEVIDGVPECTFLELDADDASPVRDKHLKLIHVGAMVGEIVTACAKRVTATPEGFRLDSGPTTAEQVRAVRGMQRRRRNPSDRELLKQVATVYKNNPDAPIAAVMRELEMSRRTAGRWAARCSEAGLLAQVDGKGKKRL